MAQELKTVTFTVAGEYDKTQPLWVLAANPRLEGGNCLYDRIAVAEFYKSPEVRERWLLAFTTKDIAAAYLSKIPADDDRTDVMPAEISPEMTGNVVDSVRRNDLISLLCIDHNPEQAWHLARIIERGGEWKGSRSRTASDR